MRVACLQFAPELGKVQENIARANALLKDLLPGHCDILVLPEMAFSGLRTVCLNACSCMPKPDNL